MTKPTPGSKAAYRAELREQITQNATLSQGYLLMNVLAAVIASYGLLANSPSVVIGAMIVAMLLGPIMGVSLALVDSNSKLLRHSVTALGAGVAVVVVSAVAVGLIHRDIPITNEILARTAPNLLDLMVALASGAVGAYATVSPRLSVAFVGVAIATALVPPLCAACILFAHGQIHLALGALLLTFLNMVAIQFASSLVLWLNGFHPRLRTVGESFSSFLRQHAFSIGLLVALAVGLGLSLNRVVKQRLYESNVENDLRAHVESVPGNHLVEVRVEQAPTGTNIIRAVVRGPVPPGADEVALIEDNLPAAPHGRQSMLRIRFVHTTVIDRNGPVYRDHDYTQLP
jgi:uncharacterized hydrophobic protein (TIGR00271 family)